MRKIKKDDMVVVMKGKDKGKKGKVLITYAHANRGLIEGINLCKKHKRRTRDDQKGGIISTEAPLSLANVMLFCKSCNKAARVGFMYLKDNTKARFCKSCKEAI